MPRIRATAALAAVLAYALIVLGALVRSTNSGLSCPDWPTCYGHWVLTPDEFAALPTTGYTYFQVMLEWVHRFIAGVLLGPLVLVIAVLTWLVRRRGPGLARAGALLLLLLLVQGALGGLTVLDRNSPWSVALHLGNALLLLSALIWIAVRASAARHEPAGTLVTGLAAGAWLLALATMAAAAVTAKSGASLACSTWPLCDGQLVPALDDPLVRIHFTHRALAAVLALTLLALWVACRGVPTGLRALSAAVLALVACQILLGALVIVLEVPIWKAVLHQAVGVLTFAMLTVLLWRAVGIGGTRPAVGVGGDGGRTGGLALRSA